MVARGQFHNFLWTQKLQNLKVRNDANFTVIFPTLWKCAGDFLRFYWNLKWPPRINFKFFVAAKAQNLVRNYINFTITFPTLWRCAHVISWFNLNSKWPPRMNYMIIFCGRKNSKIIVWNNLNFTIALPTIGNCAGDFTELHNGHHKSTCGRKNSHLICGGDDIGLQASYLIFKFTCSWYWSWRN